MKNILVLMAILPAMSAFASSKNYHCIEFAGPHNLHIPVVHAVDFKMADSPSCVIGADVVLSTLDAQGQEVNPLTFQGSYECCRSSIQHTLNFGTSGAEEGQGIVQMDLTTNQNGDYTGSVTFDYWHRTETYDLICKLTQ